MHKFRVIGEQPKTRDETPSPISTKGSAPSEQIELAEEAVLQLFKLLPALDVPDPRSLMAGAVDILAQYPAIVMMRACAPRGIPACTDRPTLRLIKEKCDELYAPIEREAERAQAHNEATKARELPKPPLTPEEKAVRAEKVAAWRRSRGVPDDGLPRRGPQTRETRPIPKSVFEDLAARKTRNEAREQSDDGNSESDAARSVD